MRRLTITILGLMTLSLQAAALASEAETSANVGSNGHGDGIAEAGAGYDGEIGFARTDTRSGSLTVARGLAIGLDKNGLSLSSSHALAHKAGFAFGTNFNLTIARDGQVAFSSGRSLSQGDDYRSAGVSGRTGSHGLKPTAESRAFGKSDDHGTVKTDTKARTTRLRKLRAKSRRRGTFNRRRR